ncbi:MAG: hypothetical protein JWO25_3604 [Alphaproteobacteria bacterium]|nr:hypothetical protein [Alphaproteobacteria bacterium]
MVAACAALAGCASFTRPPKARPTVTLEAGDPWRNVATAKDEQLLGRLRPAWAEAVAKARKAGFVRSLDRTGNLFDPAAALPRPAPSPGAYSCRLYTIGSLAPRDRPFVAGRSFFCFVGVEGGQLSFTADLVPTRIGGYLWDQDGAAQLTFLGSSARGRSVPLPPYGKTSENGVPGIFERIGEFRYRLVLASSVLGGELAILELKPVLPAS